MEGTTLSLNSNFLKTNFYLSLQRGEDFPLVHQSYPDHPWVFQMREGPYPSDLERKWQGDPDGLFNGFEDGINSRLFNVSKEFKSEVDLFRIRPPHLCMGCT